MSADAVRHQVAQLEKKLCLLMDRYPVLTFRGTSTKNFFVFLYTAVLVSVAAAI
jgi:hypothetical protein